MIGDVHGQVLAWFFWHEFSHVCLFQRTWNDVIAFLEKRLRFGRTFRGNFVWNPRN